MEPGIEFATPRNSAGGLRAPAVFWLPAGHRPWGWGCLLRGLGGPWTQGGFFPRNSPPGGWGSDPSKGPGPMPVTPRAPRLCPWMTRGDRWPGGRVGGWGGGGKPLPGTPLRPGGKAGGGSSTGSSKGAAGGMGKGIAKRALWKSGWGAGRRHLVGLDSDKSPWPVRGLEGQPSSQRGSE
ncbi:hypothetical protein ACJJTC_008403 [Scirpophaga incertulas]